MVTRNGISFSFFFLHSIWFYDCCFPLKNWMPLFCFAGANVDGKENGLKKPVSNQRNRKALNDITNISSNIRIETKKNVPKKEGLSILEPCSTSKHQGKNFHLILLLTLLIFFFFFFFIINFHINRDFCSVSKIVMATRFAQKKLINPN